MATVAGDSAAAGAKHERWLVVENYPVEGVSIGGKETCVIFPTLRLAFDIGACPRHAISQEFLFVSHGHLVHIGTLHKYVVACGFLGRARPATVFVPACLQDRVEQLFELYRDISQSELKHNLVPLDVGEEYELRSDLKGYVIHSVKEKLKEEFNGLPRSEIKQLKSSGVQITNTESTPEIAFTGDTTSDFILDPDNADVLRAKVLVVESTFLDDSSSVEHARRYGHTHLSEIARQCDKLENKAILLNQKIWSKLRWFDFPRFLK